VDPVSGDIYSLESDVGDKMVRFPREADGNVVPKAWRDKIPDRSAARALATAGVALRFRTDSKRITIRLTFIDVPEVANAGPESAWERARPPYFDVYRDGLFQANVPAKIAYYEQDVTVFDNSTEPAKDSEFSILFPHYYGNAEVIVKGIGLDKDARAFPSAPRNVPVVLFHGDSITHGHGVTSPRETYVWQTCEGANCEPLNLGFGGSALRGFRTLDGEQTLADIARRKNLSRNSLRLIKSFLSGVFKQVKRLGILDAINPMVDVRTPRAPEAQDTYAYSLDEVKRMLLVLQEPAKMVVLTAALSGLRKSEIRGLRWEDFTGKELSVNRSIWNSEVNEPKTMRSKAPIPVVKQLADALEEHRQGMGKLAVGPIFQAGDGKPLNVDNLVRREIIPAISGTGVEWHDGQAFRRGLATTLHQLRVADKTRMRWARKCKAVQLATIL